MNDQPAEAGFDELLDYLRRTRGFDFSAYKPTSLKRRIRKRLQTLGIETYPPYVDYLEVHPDEFSQLFNTILINVTEFFRDAPAWEAVAQDILPRLLNAKRAHDPIRVWSAGCASGQEAYTISMLLAEAIGPAAFMERVKIYATDVDEEALTEARQATYTRQQVESVPAELRGKYFDQVNHHYVFNKELRRSVIFGRHDLLQDAPISRVDLLICRNTLMYFNAEAQARILSRFDFALNGGGYLFLGKAEVLLTRSTSFTPVDIKRRLFTKVAKPRQHERPALLPELEAPEGSAGPSPSLRLREVAMDVDPVAQAIVDLNGSLVSVNAQARYLLGLSRDDVGARLQDLQLYRPVDMRYMIEQAVGQRHMLQLKEIEWNVPGGDKCFLDVQAIPLFDEDGQALGVKIIFTDVTRFHAMQEELQHSHQELETVNEELQSSNEELETTNEELQSTVEELETTNEELQSTNEELETMNEELQSTNEELEAANLELRIRGEELNGLNAFLESVMAGLGDGVVVLDRSFQVRAWNHTAEDLWGLRADEVRGKSFFALDFGLPVEQLKPQIRAGLNADGDEQESSVVVAATNRRGRPIQVRFTVTRLRGPQDEVQGVILLTEELRDGGTAA